MSYPTAPPGPAAPTRVRYGVVAFALTLAVITYVDRICITKTADLIRHDLKLTREQMAWVFTAFTVTYGIFEIPWGFLADRIGARKVLLRIVLCWSLFTAATGWVWNLGSLLVTRALFGVGEAGCFPSLTKTFTTWLPENERVRAQGILWLAARWGGAFTPLLVIWVLGFTSSWRRTFEIFGALGVVWAAFFWWRYRDDPRGHPGVNDAERRLIPPPGTAPGETLRVPWRRLLSSRRVWLLWMQYFFLAYGAYFYLTWLPTYLKEVRKVEGSLGAVLDGVPLFFMGLGSIFCGFFLSRLARWTGGSAQARRLMAITGFLGASLFLYLSVQIADPVWAVLVMGLAAFANDLVMPSSWAACMDLGGRYAGTLSASMNMMGCAGASFSPLVVAWIVDKWTKQDWNMVFYVSAGAYFLGALCWIFLDPVTPLESESKEAGA